MSRGMKAEESKLIYRKNRASRVVHVKNGAAFNEMEQTSRKSTTCLLVCFSMWSITISTLKGDIGYKS